MMTNHNFCSVRRMKGKRAHRRREFLKQQQNNLCHWCRVEMTAPWKKGHGVPKKTAITIDHVVPLCEGGNNYVGNTVAACDYCNNRRNTEAARANKALHDAHQARLQAMEIELNGGTGAV